MAPGTGKQAAEKGRYPSQGRHPPQGTHLSARASPDFGLLGLRPNPIDAAAAAVVRQSGPGHDKQAESLKPQTGGPAVVNRSVAGCVSPVTRGSTSPPLRQPL